MSYCRFSMDSDVYVIRLSSGQIDCVGCDEWLTHREEFDGSEEQRIAQHLRWHEAVLAHQVPRRVFERLMNEHAPNAHLLPVKVRMLVYPEFAKP